MMIVIDANLWIGTIIPSDYSTSAQSRLHEWGQSRARIVVPTLWHYEVISSLRKAVALDMLSAENARTAMSELVLMAFEEISPSYELDRLAFTWAERLGQVIAYDAQYLALAEHLGAEFWTADKRLANNARQLQAAWVHWVGEE